MDAQAPRTCVRALFINAPLFTDLGYAKAPSCLFVAYANDSRYFDKHLPLLEQLVGRIQIRKSP